MSTLESIKKISFTHLSNTDNRKTIIKKEITKKNNRDDHSDIINNQDDFFTISIKQMMHLKQNGGKTL